MCDPGSVALQARATADSQLEARGKPRWCIQPARSCRRDSRAELVQAARGKQIQLTQSEKDVSADRTSAEEKSVVQPAAHLAERHREAQPLAGRHLVKKNKPSELHRKPTLFIHSSHFLIYGLHIHLAF